MKRKRLETIARIGYSDGIPGGWASLSASERDYYCEVAEDVLNGTTYDGMMHYETLVKAAAEVWDAAVEAMAGSEQGEPL